MNTRRTVALLVALLAPAVAHACAMALSSCDLMPCCDTANYECLPLPQLGSGMYCVPRAAAPVAPPQTCACECSAPANDEPGSGIELWPGLGVVVEDFAGGEPKGVEEGDTKKTEEFESVGAEEAEDNSKRTDGLSAESGDGGVSLALTIVLGAGGMVAMTTMTAVVLLIFKAMHPQSALVSQGAHTVVDIEAGTLGAGGGSGSGNGNGNGNGGNAERPRCRSRVQFDRLFEPWTDCDLFPECSRPGVATGELPELVFEAAEDGSVFNREAERLDIGVEEIPSGTPTHLSIAVDASLMSCNANSVGGDNRDKYAAGVASVLRVLAVPAIGSVSTSIVAFAGDAAEVPEELADEPVFSDLAKVERSLKRLQPPQCARATGMHDRASPLGAMRAVDKCIELLRTWNPTEIQQRRVLVLTGGDTPAPEMSAMRERVGGANGEAWKTANCVVVAMIGKQVDRAAGVQLGAVAVELDSIEEFGARETARVLARLFVAQNPRRAHIKAHVVDGVVPVGEREDQDPGTFVER